MSDSELSSLWTVVASVFVLVAAVGVVFVVQGFTRHRSVSTMASRSLLVAAAAVLGFAGAGYGFAFGSGTTLIGGEWFVLDGIDLTDPVMPGGSTHGAVVLWNGVTVVLVALVVTAGVVGRATQGANVAAGALVGALLFPVAQRSVSPDGLLADLSIGDSRFVDAGGAVVVHSLAGWAALVGALVVGPRLGRFGSVGQPRVIPGRSMPLAVAGSLLFLAGGLGLSADPSTGWSDDVPVELVGVLLGASAGTLGAAAVSRWRGGSVGTASSVRGLLAGFVSASAGAAVLDPVVLVLVGALGGVLATSVFATVERVQVDDPVGMFAVFGVGGLWGALAVGVFDGGVDQLAVQAVGALIVAGWSVAATGLVYGSLRALGQLRISEEDELVGLDVSEQQRSLS